MQSLFFITLFFLPSICESYTACLEPTLCNCLSGCDVLSPMSYGGAEHLPCDTNLLVVPNFGTYWNARRVKQAVTVAKEKLEFEGAKEFDAVWKPHAMAVAKGGVTAYMGLLGISLNAVKARYQAKIAEVLKKTMKKQCEVAKCIAFCAASCESQCDYWGLESTDEDYLASIGWTKAMCDVDGSKTTLKETCNDIKTNAEGCDANCDGSSGLLTAQLLLVPLTLSLMLN